MSLTTSDKTVLTKYPPLPSKCVICLRDSNGEIDFIDFQMSVDVYGAVVICVGCFVPVADLLGYVKREDLEEVNEQLSNVVALNRKYLEENGHLNRTLDTILDLRPAVSTRSLPNADEDHPQLEITVDAGTEDESTVDG